MDETEFKKLLLNDLGKVDEPLVTRYRLGILTHKIIRSKSGFSIKGVESQSELAWFNGCLRSLEDTGVLIPDPDLPNSAYRILGRPADDLEEAVCAVDSFCYLSHLSAMAHHGLTDRMPAKIFISSPSPREWSADAEKKMKTDLGADLQLYREERMPELKRPKLTRLGGLEVHRFSSKRWGAFKKVRNGLLRVSSMGRTFLDMLRNPELCGGMRHVVGVFMEHGKTYDNLIIDEIDRNGSPIDKVRAGYILEEKLGLGNDVIHSWSDLAQRGGSRKLDASAEFADEWSEKWCISLNL